MSGRGRGRAFKLVDLVPTPAPPPKPDDDEWNDSEGEEVAAEPEEVAETRKPMAEDDWNASGSEDEQQEEHAAEPEGAIGGRDDRSEPKGIYSTKPENITSKEGTTGEIVNLSANYFQLTQTEAFEFSCYRVDITPETDDDSIRRGMLAQHGEKLGGYLFSGHNLFLTRRLPDDITKFESRSKEGVDYSITIKNTKRIIKMTDGVGFQILNLILKRAMAGLKMQLVGRNLYDPNSKVSIPNFKVELWPGYITSIRQHEKNVLVCCEVSHKVMRMETIRDIMVGLQKNASWIEDFKREVIGSVVLTAYNNRTYRIDDVDFEATPMSKFKQNEEEITIVQYYRNRHHLEIRDSGQPMLVCARKARDARGGQVEKVLLVPELCRATGLTEQHRANFQMMKEMAVHTQMDPTNRKTRLLKFASRMNEDEACSSQLTKWNTILDRSLVEFKGRALPQETMEFGGGKTAKNNEKVDWTMASKLNPMYHSVPLKRWVFIYPQKLAADSQEFLKLMQEVAEGFKYEMATPKMIQLLDDKTQTYTNAVSEIARDDPKLIMVVLPTATADRYAAIKKITYCSNAIPSQIIVGKTMKNKGVKSIATKVVIQLNCKLGGAPWTVKFPVKGLMAIGYDVTHDTRDKSKSFGAFVASMDLKQCVEFYSSVTAHKDGAEIAKNIAVQFRQALRVYKTKHGAFPERIFFYRDGVGDGSIEYVHTQELNLLKSVLSEAYGTDDDAYKFTYIIVSKRINTRIFLNRGSGVTNPTSGTVVDTTITLPERYDFFLVSQSVRQGTVAPTSYNVIYSSDHISPDKLQMLTYKMCHLYFNWAGTVRVPAVVQYAHKLSFLTGQFLNMPASKEFGNLLYYL